MSQAEARIAEIISRRLAAPKRWRVTTHYADGDARTLDHELIQQAQSYALREREKIGRDLIDPKTGQTVRVVAVEIGGVS